jgi:hypothetical protein
MGELAMENMRQGLPQHRGLEVQLLFVCEHWAGKGYDRVKENPDAKDGTHIRHMLALHISLLLRGLRNV